MAHFAELDENNIVIQVVVVDDLDTRDENNDENEAVGIHFLRNIFGATTNWKQTSYNHNIRKQYAGIGMTYDETNDVFIRPQPFPSWNLNSETFDWEAPTPYPDDGEVYIWNEDTESWDEA
tara:strand:- start:44 stop:406 length:363 start_codon:yes stop_codon:yes gene_type:complete